MTKENILIKIKVFKEMLETEQSIRDYGKVSQNRVTDLKKSIAKLKNKLLKQ